MIQVQKVRQARIQRLLPQTHIHKDILSLSSCTHHGGERFPVINIVQAGLYFENARSPVCYVPRENQNFIGNSGPT